jgi:hypothetical protein
VANLWAVSYTSVAARPLSAGDLDALLQDAQAFNQGVGVSGVLCYDGGVFVQYFEGPEAAVRQVYERILASRLHQQLEELSYAPVQARQFDGWHMAFCQLPETVLQALANTGWEADLPVTRGASEPNRGLSMLLYRWNRWVAGGQRAAADTLRARVAG